MVVSNSATAGEKELRKDWPVEEGLEAGTTKRSSAPASLEAQEEKLMGESWGGV